jgi:hypothetical protein
MVLQSQVCANLLSMRWRQMCDIAGIEQAASLRDLPLAMLHDRARGMIVGKVVHRASIRGRCSASRLLQNVSALGVPIGDTVLCLLRSTRRLCKCDAQPTIMFEVCAS